MSSPSPEWKSHSVKENVAVSQPLKVMTTKAKNKRRGNLSPGTTCHQCHQQSNNFAGACKTYRKKGRKGPCPLRYCRRCLLNRYGEAEEAERDDWICPMCRGICNCSCCRSNNGEMPTGALAHIAKANGCTSVHDLLQKRPEAVAAAQALRSTSQKGRKRAKGTYALASEFPDEGHENMGTGLNAIPFVPTEKRTKCTYKVNSNFDDGRPAWLRDEITNITDAQLADEDVIWGANLLVFLGEQVIINVFRKIPTKAKRAMDLGGRAGLGEGLSGCGGEEGSLVPGDRGEAGDWGGNEGPSRREGEEGSLVPSDGDKAGDWDGIKGPSRCGGEEGDASSEYDT
ncbi:hypothetical protein BAE44_0007520 [Dichanthelium oligosanthes]|uniref:Zinc-finger domain-containing protein n=1 Tax=Dichanthelium oligosanthes TaxID=888268 RepID=A0A1E5W2G9_9POAL|nr:hypothetical protein BAE44_0007520 [Dichanthelium oligosanthes]